MTKFHRLRVSDIRRETADSVSVGFEVPSDLTNDYHYRQGQYLTLRIEMNGEEVRRSYSICSAPHETGELRIGVKAVPGGRMSTYINETLKVGDSIEVMTPMGTFTSPIDPSHRIQYILIAGGSGITPMLSILKTVLFAEPYSSVLLLYANRNQESVMFRTTIDELSLAYKERLKVKYIYDDAPDDYPAELRGLMTVEKINTLLDLYDVSSDAKEYFICGPTPMMDNALAVLQSRKIAENKIHIEYFSAPTNTTTEASKVQLAKNAKAVIIKDGDEYETVMKEGETVLEAAMRIGLDAPYSCQSGTCATCRAKLVEGEVDMKTSFALNADDKKRRFILTCQARPLTDHIVVNYDEAM